MSSRNLSPEELEDRREERKLKLELAKLTLDQVLYKQEKERALAKLVKEQALDEKQVANIQDPWGIIERSANILVLQTVAADQHKWGGDVYNGGEYPEEVGVGEREVWREKDGELGDPGKSQDVSAEEGEAGERKNSAPDNMREGGWTEAAAPKREERMAATQEKDSVHEDATARAQSRNPRQVQHWGCGLLKG
ncbi:hypothetical protein NDU88_001000 [Pleurodeles waltl]|uniref:Uncharacterized protein n=1 Tax=Pleurodeles waltl TaxID=8319 RepID=A0AAV7VAG5_PLEWA|nr:hypothetical protein NDU88_001000 [Pleurodeles waltl]